MGTTGITLHELSRQYLEVLELIKQPDFTDEMLGDTLDALDVTIQDKGGNIAKLCQSILVNTVGMKEVEDRIAKRRKFYENKVVALKKYLKKNMEALKMTEIELPDVVIKIVTNPGKVVVENADMVPPFYRRRKVITEIDKAKIKKRYQEDESANIIGVRFEKGTRLEIK